VSLEKGFDKTFEETYLCPLSVELLSKSGFGVKDLEKQIRKCSALLIHMG